MSLFNAFNVTVTLFSLGKHVKPPSLGFGSRFTLSLSCLHSFYLFLTILAIEKMIRVHYICFNLVAFGKYPLEINFN